VSDAYVILFVVLIAGTGVRIGRAALQRPVVRGRAVAPSGASA
jgi:hypothetical protein